MLAFVHIPKTAGTTLHKVISHQFPRKKIFIHHDTDGPPTAELAARIESQATSVVMGHFSVGFHRFIPSLRYVTCLRDPVPRLVSHYRHALHDPSHYLHHEAKSRSLAQYVSSGLSGELSDGMTRMLAGVPDFHHGVVDQSTLDLAISNLETRFIAIIPSERFDEGLLLLAREIGWKTPYYLRRKVGRHPGTATPLDAEAIRAIEEHNRYDRQLYDLCAARFAQSADIDPDLSRQLARFRKTNAALGKAVFFAREFKSRYLQPCSMKALALSSIRLAGRIWCRWQGAEVHPSALIHGFPRIIRKTGATIRIGPGVTINAAGWSNAHNDGRRTILYAGPSALIDLCENCGLSSSRIIAYEKITIGASTLIGAGSLICDSDMHEIPLCSANPVRVAPISIGARVFLGAVTTVLKGAEIGDGAVIGASSVVSGIIAPGVIAAGNPARTIRVLPAK